MRVLILLAIVLLAVHGHLAKRRTGKLERVKKTVNHPTIVRRSNGNANNLFRNNYNKGNNVNNNGDKNTNGN
ncbi:unnamed protein product [Nippostrongylus brasiliensis]|uniref:Secreted protein n=1 Tax=Nippostrongylus brasiliensis TaxID=27835 RepID=A0A0N4Y1H5_NIPBR|nr:unnamed protein product [Nippostrongylus brasiliensis]